MVPAAWHLATTPVAAQHFASNGGRDVLRGALLHLRLATHVSRQPLRIALSHLCDRRRDLDELASALLPSSAAVFADAQLDLVTSAAVIDRTAEHVACHQQQRRVVVERTSGVAAKLRHRVAERRQNFAGYLEAQHMPPQAIVGWIGRQTPANPA